MQRFSSGGFGQSDDKWFTVGNFDVTTTALVTFLSLFMVLAIAFQGGGAGTLASALVFDSSSVTSGQVWRIVTWPIVNSPGIFELLTLVFFYMLGTQLELNLGRHRMAMLLGYMTVLPALLVTIISVITGGGLSVAGLDLLELGVLVAFVLAYPGARFFFGIPGWVLAAVFVAITIASVAKSPLTLLFVLVLFGLSLLISKAFGLANEITWIPKIPLPAGLGGDPYHKSARSRRKADHLKVVRAQEEMKDEIDQIEIDAILDQVSDGGMDSLSKAQRRKLESYSKQQRKKKGR